MTLTTDHTQATADGAHSHGIVPDKSRADRLTSFDPEAFGIPNAREEQWRFSAGRDFKPLFALEGGEGHLEWSRNNFV